MAPYDHVTGTQKLLKMWLWTSHCHQWGGDALRNSKTKRSAQNVSILQICEKFARNDDKKCQITTFGTTLCKVIFK